ncbi:hypothetical protein ACFQ0M_45240 [Kitasatospora aburaviensis]
MVPIVSRAAACAQLLRHFTETLRTWPAGTALALRHPDLPKAVLHGGVTMGLALDFDEEGPDDASAVFTIRYWVIGATPRTPTGTSTSWWRRGRPTGGRRGSSRRTRAPATRRPRTGTGSRPAGA